MIAYEDHLCNWVKRSKSSCGYGDVLIPDPTTAMAGGNHYLLDLGSGHFRMILKYIFKYIIPTSHPYYIGLFGIVKDNIVAA
jgi:hypothetical protein